LLYLLGCTMVQRLHQVKGHPLGIRTLEDFWIELDSVGQVVMQVRVSLLDTRERLTQRHRTQRRQDDIHSQVHEDPKSEETVEERDERYKGNNILHPYPEEEDSEADREQHNATLQQTSQRQAASHTLHKCCQQVMLLDHHSIFLSQTDIHSVLMCRKTLR